MKKFICLFLALCLAMAALCVPAAAQEPTPSLPAEQPQNSAVLPDEEGAFSEQTVSLEEENSSEGHSIVIQSYDAVNDKYTYWDPWNNQTSTFSQSELERSEIQMAYDIANAGHRRLAWVQYCR